MDFSFLKEQNIVPKVVTYFITESTMHFSPFPSVILDKSKPIPLPLGNTIGILQDLVKTAIFECYRL